MKNYLMAIWFIFEASAFAVEGNIAVWHNGKPVALRVTLPTDENRKLINKFVSFSNVPKDFTPNSEGCFWNRVLGVKA